MLLFMQKRLMLMLSVHVQKQTCDCPQLCRRNGFIVDAADAARLSDFFRNDHEPFLIRNNRERF